MESGRCSEEMENFRLWLADNEAHQRLFSELQTHQHFKSIDLMALHLSSLYICNLRDRLANKLVAFGNGGSCQQAENLVDHLTAEIVGRYKRTRPSLYAVSFTKNTATLTAIANDFGYERVFERQVEGCAQENDAVLGISTSGRSSNVVKALQKAKERGAVTMAFTGKDGIALPDGTPMDVDYCFKVPHETTALIQMGHLFGLHHLCDRVDEAVVDFLEHHDPR